MREGFLRWMVKPSVDASALDKFETYTSLTIISVFATIPHIFFFFFFLQQRQATMMWVNFVSIWFYVFSLFCIRQHLHYIGSMLITLEVGLYALICAWMFGWEANTHWFIVVALLPHYLFSDVTGKQRIGLTVFLWVVLNTCLVISLVHEPSIKLPAMDLLKAIHINIVFFALLLELVMNTIVRGMTKRMNQSRLVAIRAEGMVDQLTQLHNRRYVDSNFGQWVGEVARHKAVLALIDLDKFKQINDTYGHGAGDDALRAFSEGIRSLFRHTDLKVRWGGDEFLLGMHNVTEEQAYQVLLKLRKHFEHAPLTLHGDVKLHLLFSAGVCAYDADKGLEETLTVCDERLYASKRRSLHEINWQGAPELSEEEEESHAADILPD